MASGIETGWLTSATITYVPSEGGSFGPNSAPLAVAADVGTGTVVVQMLDSTSTWVALADGTISADDSKVVDTRNQFGLRVIATGDAKYRARWID